MQQLIAEAEQLIAEADSAELRRIIVAAAYRLESLAGSAAHDAQFSSFQ
jgi:hypothetical protein